MNRQKITFLLALFLSMVGANALAQDEYFDFEIDGIYYAIWSSESYYDSENHIYYDGTVSVVNPNGYGNWDEPSPYEGDIYIPSSIIVYSDESEEYWDSASERKYAVTSISSGAFAYCYNLTSIFIPASVKRIGEWAFTFCSALVNVSVDSNLSFTTWTSWGGICEDGEIGLRDTPWYRSQSGGVVYLGKVAYGYKDSNNQSVSIRQGTERIGFCCFNDATINGIPNSIISIGAGAFRNCKFSSFSLPNNLTELGSSAFENSEGLTNVTIPDNVKVFYASTFRGCGLSSLTIGKGVKCILRNNCSIYLPHRGEDGYDYEYDTIERNEIQNHPKWWLLTDMSIISQYDSYYDGMDYYDYYCQHHTDYFDHPSQESPRYGLDVQTIKVAEGNTVFDSRDNCNAVIHTNTNTLVLGSASTTVPNNITSIGWNAFRDCSITSLTIPSSVGSMDIETFRGSELTSITIPSSISSISTCAFANCTELKSVIIEDGLTTIDDCAFACSSKLSTIVIPSSVTGIGSSAFSGCSSLTSVTVEMETPVNIYSETFSNRTNATLYVPYGCKAAYEAALYWKEFKEIVEMEPTGVEVTDISQMDNVIYIEPTEGRCGSQTTLSVKMKNDVAIQTIQFDLYLPDGITVVPNEDDELVTVSKERINRFNYFESSMQSDGALRLLAQATSTNVPVGDGEICRIVVDIPESMEEGDYPLVIKGALMVENDNTSHSPDPNLVQTKLTVLKYVLGDANNDGEVNAIDFNMIGNYILGQSQSGFNLKAADISGDGDVNAIDFNMVGNMILNGSTASARERTTEDAKDPE